MNLDWSQLVSNLRGAGMSARGIARQCGMEPQTISRLQAGVQHDPRWNQGVMLLDLHYSLCPDKHKLERLKR